ncbi:amidase [Aquibacillus koreensis]|uniref:Amidase n=1 Tax=Aquibacillus koreensis TaxID=279446 RepID=A0A9X3WJT6_9BACI|nr:amidase [Aquibacillus koreensis]MCT2537092.1 amidase [Aquibacillus koreensis]MDC3419925.1 amidase [Aquibacillus koreensis]
MTNLLDRSFLEIADLYRKKEVSPVEIVNKTLKRQKELEPILNAFISVFEKDAIKQANQIEKKFLNNESLHVLAGIPYAVKDLFYTKDVRTTCGSNILTDYKPDYTATVLNKLASTDAVLIGKNNMLEFAYGIVHPDFGQTNNPWDVTKTSGGSSSGSVAAVASGTSYFSLGTDTGGSIRIPASYCGVVGLKPTRGLVSTYGVFPLSWSLDHAGPITRTIQEAAVVLDAIAGHDLNDPYSLTGKITAIDLHAFKVKKEPQRVGILPSEKLTGLRPSVKKVYEDTLKQIEMLNGFELVEIEISDWDRTEEIVMNVLLPEAAHIHQKWMGRKAEYATLTYKQLELGIKQLAIDYLNGLKDLRHYTNSVSALFQHVDFILTPTVAFPAPAEDPVIGSEELDEMVFTGPFNISGHPAVTLNLGFTEDSLPIGMQLVAPHFHDTELLEAAYQLEQTHIRKLPTILTGE